MKAVPTKPGRPSKDMKRSIIPFKRSDVKPLERGQFHTYKLRTTLQTQRPLSTSSCYLSSRKEAMKSGFCSDVV
eukprot:4207274-Ditylum_brightwellii.AAC.1